MYETKDGWRMEHHPRRPEKEEHQIIAGQWEPKVQLPQEKEGNMITEIEKVVLEAAEKNDDSLQDLLQQAIEQLREERANRLMDKVHQIQKENLLAIRGWHGTVRCDECGKLVSDDEAEDRGFRVGPDLIEYPIYICFKCAGVDDYETEL